MSFGYMACNNSTLKCYYNNLIETEKYFEHINTIIGKDDNETLKLRNEYICGTNKQDTLVQECCLKTDKTTTELVNGKLMKINKDENGNITEYRICNCKNKQCEEKICKDFKQPTQYEVCKARTFNPEHLEKISHFEHKISYANSFPDCFNKCI